MATLAQLIDKYDGNGFILIDAGNGCGGPNWQPWSEEAAAIWGDVKMTSHAPSDFAYEDTNDTLLDAAREVIPEYACDEIHASEWMLDGTRGEFLPDNPYRYRILF